MKIPINLPTPVIRALNKIGRDANIARRRRRISIKLMAERAGVSRGTIGKIEKGDSTVSIGGYSAVLFVLGMTDKLSDLIDSRKDSVGLNLEEEILPQRIRIPKK